jgi:hypothetical protein
MTLVEAIIKALEALGGEGTIQDVHQKVNEMHPSKWKDPSTALADMVPVYLGGNTSSNVKDEFRVLDRVEKGRYRLIYK